MNFRTVQQVWMPKMNYNFTISRKPPPKSFKKHGKSQEKITCDLSVKKSHGFFSFFKQQRDNHEVICEVICGQPWRRFSREWWDFSYFFMGHHGECKVNPTPSQCPTKFPTRNVKALDYGAEKVNHPGIGPAIISLEKKGGIGGLDSFHEIHDSSWQLRNRSNPPTSWFARLPFLVILLHFSWFALQPHFFTPKNHIVHLQNSEEKKTNKQNTCQIPINSLHSFFHSSLKDMSKNISKKRW